MPRENKGGQEGHPNLLKWFFTFIFLFNVKVMACPAIYTKRWSLHKASTAFLISVALSAL